MMTVKEHLYLVCDLKNVLKSKVEKTVNETLDIVMLKEFANK
jgi:ABC-type multidrug transport system ATPase subunit